MQLHKTQFLCTEEFINFITMAASQQPCPRSKYSKWKWTGNHTWWLVINIITPYMTTPVDILCRSVPPEIPRRYPIIPYRKWNCSKDIWYVSNNCQRSIRRNSQDSTEIVVTDGITDLRLCGRKGWIYRQQLAGEHRETLYLTPVSS